MSELGSGAWCGPLGELGLFGPTPPRGRHRVGLILLHGWPRTSRAWARVMPALAQRHTVVVPDLRGTGASDRQP